MNITMQDIQEMDIDLLKESLEELKKERSSLRTEAEKVINGSTIKEIERRIIELKNKLPDPEATIHKTAPSVMDHKDKRNTASNISTRGTNTFNISF